MQSKRSFSEILLISFNQLSLPWLSSDKKKPATKNGAGEKMLVANDV